MQGFDQRDTLGFAAAQLARHLAMALREALQPVGLMPAQFSALLEISRDPGLTQKQLVERLDVEQPGVARTLTGLADDGWIERRSLAGRSQGLYLTDKARAVLPAAIAAAAAVNQRALSDLSRTERGHLIDQIGEIVSALKAG